MAILALVMAIGFSAFTPAEKSRLDSDMVWFRVNADDEVQDPSSGTQGDNPPAAWNCFSTVTPCAKGFLISEGDVNPTGTPGIYSLDSGTDEFADADGHKQKP